MKFKTTIVAALTKFALGAGSANAAYSPTGLVAGRVENPGSFTATVDASVADEAATLDFVLSGFRSADAYNTYQDVVTLTVNGVETFTGSFNLGGGGASDTSFGTGTPVTVNENGVDPGNYIGSSGTTTTVTGLSFNLLAGVNTFNFAY